MISLFSNYLLWAHDVYAKHFSYGNIPLNVYAQRLLIPYDFKEAVRNGDIKRMQSLLKCGVDINQETNGQTPLKTALTLKNDRSILFLLQQSNIQVHASALFDYVIGGANSEIVKALIAKGVDVNASDANGEVALTIAINNLNTEMVRALLAVKGIIIPENNSALDSFHFYKKLGSVFRAERSQEIIEMLAEAKHKKHEMLHVDR